MYARLAIIDRYRCVTPVAACLTSPSCVDPPTEEHLDITEDLRHPTVRRRSAHNAQYGNDLGAVEASIAPLRLHGHAGINNFADDLAAANGGQFGHMTGEYDVEGIGVLISRIGC